MIIIIFFAYAYIYELSPLIGNLLHIHALPIFLSHDKVMASFFQAHYFNKGPPWTQP